MDFWDESTTIAPGDVNSPGDVLDIGDHEAVGATVVARLREGERGPERVRYEPVDGDATKIGPLRRSHMSV